jgi:hypothetical protein
MDEGHMAQAGERIYRGPNEIVKQLISRSL